MTRGRDGGLDVRKVTRCVNEEPHASLAIQLSIPRLRVGLTVKRCRLISFKMNYNNPAQPWPNSALMHSPGIKHHDRQRDRVVIGRFFFKVDSAVT